ncbi:hypothetical protein FF1_007627 [Malus domestica]
MVKLCFQSQENHFDDHPQFLIPQLHPINPAVHSTCLSQVILATGVTRTIDHLKNMAELFVAGIPVGDVSWPTSTQLPWRFGAG